LESIKLTLSSYGPFDKLELNLTPLTIITGPNTIGKSFLMRAVYAMLAPCRDGSLDVGAIVSRLCNSSVCDEPKCLNRVLRRGSQTLELRLEAWGYSRGLRYDSTTGTIELLRADCLSVESILVPGYRAYLTPLPYFYRSIVKPIPDLVELMRKYVDTMDRELKSLLESLPKEATDTVKGWVEELLKDIRRDIGTVVEAEDLRSYLKVLMKLAEVLDRFASILSSQGIERYDIEIAKASLWEQLHAQELLYFNPPVSTIATLVEPIVQKLVPEIEIEETSEAELGKVIASRVHEIIAEELFPEVKHFNISLPGISRTPSNMPLLPASILHSYPLIVAIAYAETLSQKGVRTVLIIEEPELGLDFRRQRLLAQHLVSAVKNAKGTLTIILSTHSTEMLISLTKEVAKKRMRKHAKVYEVIDRRVRRESIGKTGRVYVKHMFEELGEIYSDV
jgi:predicted ATPase